MNHSQQKRVFNNNDRTHAHGGGAKRARSANGPEQSLSRCHVCQADCRKPEMTSTNCLQCNSTKNVCNACFEQDIDFVCGYCARYNLPELERSVRCETCDFECRHLYWQMSGARPPRNFCYPCATNRGIQKFARVPAIPPPPPPPPLQPQKTSPVVSVVATPTSTATPTVTVVPNTITELPVVRFNVTTNGVANGLSSAAPPTTPTILVPTYVSKHELAERLKQLEHRMVQCEKMEDLTSKDVYSDLQRIVALEKQVADLSSAHNAALEELRTKVHEVASKHTDCL